MPKVLYVSPGHPAVRPGGVETYALELFDGMKSSQDFEPVLLAKAAPVHTASSAAGRAAVIEPFDESGNVFSLHLDDRGYDHFHGKLRDRRPMIECVQRFLAEQRPDLVHFQHTVRLGYDLIRQVRNVLPEAPIVYTLHDFLPICHNNGQMVRTSAAELCEQASPARCHECFPDLSRQAFFKRRRLLESHFDAVDVFLAPSRFLLDRFVDWGIPRQKIRFEEYGRRRPRLLEPERGAGVASRRRDRLAFFGQLSEFKGLLVLLEAMRLLDSRVAGGGGGATLRLHGANLELQPKAFQREFSALLEVTKPNVTLAGSYAQADLPGLMANVDWVVVPSIWWENSPLVIQEAFSHRRPVICSDIGGMAEKVTDGLNGLHFRVGDPSSLAATIARATQAPDLWNELRGGIPPVYEVDEHVATLSDLYRSLLGTVAA